MITTHLVTYPIIVMPLLKCSGHVKQALRLCSSFSSIVRSPDTRATWKIKLLDFVRSKAQRDLEMFSIQDEISYSPPKCALFTV